MIVSLGGYMTNTTKTTENVIKTTEDYLLELDLSGIELEVVSTNRQTITVETTGSEKDLKYLRVLFTDKGASIKYKNPSTANNISISSITQNSNGTTIISGGNVRGMVISGNNISIGNNSGGLVINGKKVDLKEFGVEETILTRMKITVPQGINIELVTDSYADFDLAPTFKDSDITLEAQAKLTGLRTVNLDVSLSSQSEMNCTVQEGCVKADCSNQSSLKVYSTASHILNVDAKASNQSNLVTRGEEANKRETITAENLKEKTFTEIYNLTNKLLNEKDVLTKQLNTVLSALSRITDEKNRRHERNHCEDWY